MNMRPLFIGPEAKARVAEILAYAKDHPYILGKEQKVPGDNPAYVGTFNSYRTVFTYTLAPREPAAFRHLSVSVPGKKYPNPFAVWLLAQTFGFTGWDGVSADVPKDWSAQLNEDEHCVVVVQRMAA